MHLYIAVISTFLCVAAAAAETRQIIFLGDSLTDGYTLGKKVSYPSLIQQRIEQEKLPYVTVNAGVSGNTTQDALDRLPPLLKGDIAIFVVALGANDGLRDVPVRIIETNLRRILKSVHEKYPDAKLIVAAPGDIGNHSKGWEEFKELFPRLASEFDAGYIEALLKGVLGNPSLLMQDGLHPNANGQRVIAEHVWSVLRREL